MTLPQINLPSGTPTRTWDLYAPNSWQLVENAEERYLDALIRHLEAYRSGERLDPESGLPHIAHLICNAAFLSYFDSKEPHGSQS